MRLIDADELRKQMYHQAFEADTDMQRWDSGCWIRYKMFENAIESASTIDPVKRGRWVDKYGNGDWHCTRCGAIVEKHEQDYRNWYFCYHCGAKMDGENDETY